MIPLALLTLTLAVFTILRLAHPDIAPEADGLGAFCAGVAFVCGIILAVTVLVNA